MLVAADEEGQAEVERRARLVLAARLERFVRALARLFVSPQLSVQARIISGDIQRAVMLDDGKLGRACTRCGAAIVRT